MTTSRKGPKIGFFSQSSPQNKSTINAKTSWFQQEEKENSLLPDPQEILEIFWKEKIIKKSIDRFKAL